MIYFRRIKWKNLLSTGNVFTELDLCGSNSTLVVGENGSGKSTLLDALTYVLFGRPFRKINKPQLVNSITQKNLEVVIEFSIGKAEYKIIRGMKPNIFEVYQNDILINQSAEMKDYQEILEKHILKINYKSFCQVVVLGSATFQPFMQLPAGQRREIIEDLLDLQIFTTMNGLLKDKIANNKESLIESQSLKKLNEEKIKLISEHMKEVQNNNENIIREKKDRIEETQNKVSKLLDDKASLEAQLKDLLQELQDESTTLSKFSKITKLQHQINAKLSHISGELDFFTNHDNCPTCMQEINKDFKCESVNDRQSKIDEINKGLSDLQIELDKINEKITYYNKVKSDIMAKQLDVNSIDVNVKSLLSYEKQLNDEIQNIQKTNDDIDDSKLIEHQEDLKRVTELLKQQEEDKLTLAAASSILRDGGIKSKIIKQYVPVINKLINKYLAALEFVVQFELDEEFNETIKSRFRDEFSYSSFSEGEKMRINLAVLFTWRAVAKLRNSINTNILIMDEVFDSSLDSSGIEEFMKILNQLTSDTNTFIISHKQDQIGDKFSNVIKFEKKQNFSRIAA